MSDLRALFSDHLAKRCSTRTIYFKEGAESLASFGKLKLINHLSISIVFRCKLTCFTCMVMGRARPSLIHSISCRNKPKLSSAICAPSIKNLGSSIFLTTIFVFSKYLCKNY